MKLKAILFLFAVSGCVAPVVVTDFNGDSVTVQGPGATPDGEAAQVASQTCATRNRVAHYASSRQIHAPQYPSVTYAHLYLCNPPMRYVG